MDKDKIINLDMLRIQRGTKEVCRCIGEPHYIIDPDCRKIFCGKCGAEVDPFDAMHKLSMIGRQYIETLNRLKEEIREAEKKHRRTNLFRELEGWYYKKMYPECPHCHVPIRFEDLTSFTCEEWAMKRWEAMKHEKE
jgi:hypothetical protein